MDVITSTNPPSNNGEEDIWGPDVGMEVDNSSSSELSPPLPENSLNAKLNGMKNLSFDEYIQLLEQHSAENPSDMDAVARLIAALEIELENEDAKALILKKIWLSQNPPAATVGSNVSANSASSVSHMSTVPNKSNTPMTTAQQNGALSASEIQRRQQQNQGGNTTRRQQTNSTIPASGAANNAASQSASTSALSSSATHSNVSANVNSVSAAAVAAEPVSVPLPPLPKLASNVAMQNLEQQTVVKRNELRRGAEEAMLAVPLPNPNAPIGANSTRFGWGDMITFIPNALSPEFVYLYGLEEVVNKIQDYELVASGQPISSGCDYQPFVCCECGTDFTPQWKRKVDVLAQNCVSKTGDSLNSTLSGCSTTEVMCESCVSAVQRQRLRQDYTKKIREISQEELVKEKEIEAEFKRIRSTPSEFEKYRSEQEKKLQAQHMATYGNRNMATNLNTAGTASSGVTNSLVNGTAGVNPNVVGLQPNTAGSSNRRNPILSTMQQQSQQRQVNQNSSTSQVSNVYGLNPRLNTNTRNQPTPMSQNTMSSNVSSNRRSSNYTGNGSSSSSNVVGLNARNATNSSYSSSSNTSAAAMNQRSSATTARANQSQSTANNLNLTANTQSQQSSVNAGVSTSTAPIDLNLLNGNLPTDFQFILLQSLLAQNPVAAAFLIQNLQQQQQQQIQQQQARSTASTPALSAQNLSTFINLCLQQQAQPQSKGSHHK